MPARLRLAWSAGVAGLSICSLAASGPFEERVLPFLEKNCYECHGGKKTKGDLDLKQIRDDQRLLPDLKLWRGVLHQVNTGEMPPKKHSVQPTPDDIAVFNQAMDDALAAAEAKLPPDPGRVTARRLNRTEYNNTVRDLLDVDFDASENFPADDIGHGFDNIGDVLSVSPVHLERYLDAAEGIAERAVVMQLPKPPERTTFSIFLEPGGYGSEDGTRPVTNAIPELFVRHTLKDTGSYRFRVRAGASNAPTGDPVKMTLRVDDQEVLTTEVTHAPKQWESFEVTIDLPAGDHRFSARWDNRDTNVLGRTLYINEFKVIGPKDTRTRFMKRVANISPEAGEEQQTGDVVLWYLTRAFRRPPTPAEIERYSRVFARGRESAEGRFEGGLQALIQASLVSPKFLFRVELNDRPQSASPQPLDEFQLASRLSYFLWSTMPDDDLLHLASTRQLSQQLDEQVRRMLRDPKASALVQNFGMQWLQLQRLATFQPDQKLFPAFDETLRRSMLRETELFLGEIIRDDRSLLDLVDADYTYVNRPLARHYGIEAEAFPGSEAQGRRRGDRRRSGEYVRVSLPDRQRGGLLTQASILTATSNPTRTSPVKRGKWVLEQILGTPPPPPPPNVPQLEEQKELSGTLRQRMEQHRSNPSCANCHQQMDALGFAFENFDAIGGFRERDTDGAIDPSGTLPDGKSFQGAADLRRILRDKKELVARNMAEKLMTYGLGRGLEYYDERALRKILAEVARSEYRFSSLVVSIVQSDPFRLRRGMASATAADPAPKETAPRGGS
ncbi:MAG: DUF1592 domain-containing protein [Verrucomicrobiales bacterium]|nr:DUF1592 domain-containing protein [Verrucomicrobiales bacterium]